MKSEPMMSPATLQIGNCKALYMASWTFGTKKIPHEKAMI
jgi:hypothetical protein